MSEKLNVEGQSFALTPKAIGLMEEVDRRAKERGVTDPWKELEIMDEVMAERGIKL